MKRLGELSENNSEWLNRVDYCIEHGAECNDWEIDFLENVRDWLTRDRDLSPSQKHTIAKLEHLVEWGREANAEEYGYGNSD